MRENPVLSATIIVLLIAVIALWGIVITTGVDTAVRSYQTNIGRSITATSFVTSTYESQLTRGAATRAAAFTLTPDP